MLPLISFPSNSGICPHLGGEFARIVGEFTGVQAVLLLLCCGWKYSVREDETGVVERFLQIYETEFFLQGQALHWQHISSCIHRNTFPTSHLHLFASVETPGRQRRDSKETHFQH
jgi:hypothetical protein